MTAPATAMTGISAFTPISGASAAVRIAPVPNPPMPPTAAANTPTAATRARSPGSRSNALARHRARPPRAVDRDVGERRLGDLDDLGIGGTALGEHLDGDGDRRGADPLYVHVEGKQVADLHWLLEDELLYRDRRDAA